MGTEGDFIRQKTEYERKHGITSQGYKDYHATLIQVLEQKKKDGVINHYQFERHPARFLGDTSPDIERFILVFEKQNTVYPYRIDVEKAYKASCVKAYKDNLGAMENDRLLPSQ